MKTDENVAFKKTHNTFADIAVMIWGIAAVEALGLIYYWILLHVGG